MGEGERTAFGAGGFRGRCEAVRRLRPRAVLAGRARGVGTTVTVHHLEKPVLLDGTLAARFRLCGSPLALRVIAEVQVVLVRGGFVSAARLKSEKKSTGSTVRALRTTQ